MEQGGDGVCVCVCVCVRVCVRARARVRVQRGLEGGRWKQSNRSLRPSWSGRTAYVHALAARRTDPPRSSCACHAMPLPLPLPLPLRLPCRISMLHLLTCATVFVYTVPLWSHGWLCRLAFAVEPMKAERHNQPNKQTNKQTNKPPRAPNKPQCRSPKRLRGVAYRAGSARSSLSQCAQRVPPYTARLTACAPTHAAVRQCYSLQRTVGKVVVRRRQLVRRADKAGRLLVRPIFRVHRMLTCACRIHPWIPCIVEHGVGAAGTMLLDGLLRFRLEADATATMIGSLTRSSNMPNEPRGSSL